MSYNRYPVKPHVYRKIIGDTRVKNFARILHDLRFSVSINPIEANDVDLFLYKDGKLIAVFEITNDRLLSYISIGHLKRYITNLRKYDVTRVLVVSFIDNIENNVDYVTENDVKVLEIGFQTIPDEYYYFFMIRKQLGDKKPITEAYPIVKQKLIKFLKEIELYA